MGFFFLFSSFRVIAETRQALLIRFVINAHCARWKNVQTVTHTCTTAQRRRGPCNWDTSQRARAALRVVRGVFPAKMRHRGPQTSLSSNKFITVEKKNRSSWSTPFRFYLKSSRWIRTMARIPFLHVAFSGGPLNTPLYSSYMKSRMLFRIENWIIV